MHKSVQNGADFHRVERFPIIHEDKGKWNVVFAAPFDELCDSLNLVHAGEILAESCLLYGLIIVQDPLQPIKQYPGEDLVDNRELMGR
ncbi:hypothetical protein Q1695_015381 [Nippostrongylus brasiliensis]|nr:hypothetical protein Q1695_015381 [Nippostrongylus brasiliensis]